MIHHDGQASSQWDVNSDAAQLSILRQQHKRLKIDMKPIEMTKFRNAEKQTLIINAEIQVKTHYFSIQQTFSSPSARKGVTKCSNCFFFHIS